MVAVEPVIGDEDDRGVGPGELHEPAEKQVVEPVDPVDDLLVELEVGLGNPLHPGGMVGHEQMADFIDGAVVDRHEVPVGLGHQQVRGSVVRRAGLGQLLGEQPEPAIFGLVDCGSGRHQESDQVIGIDVMRADPQIVHHLGQFRRPIGAGERR